MTKANVSWCTVVCCTVCFLLVGTLPSLAAFSSDFATSDECMFCHTSNFSALVDSQGNDLSIANDWAPTMMANSFRDPLFRAKVESEIVRNPHLKAAIEDKCLTCHAPMARTQAIRHGGADYSLSEAGNNAFAADGVSCTLCHQILPDGLGEEPSFSGNYTIGDDRQIFGPYTEVLVNPMLHHVDYLPVYGEQVHKPELCATCHTLFTPIVGKDGQVTGKFPEQTPYFEWLNSIYSEEDSYQSCQDCHMPKLDEPVKITNRPPWYRKKQSPFWRHHFIGGNSFILDIVKNNRDQLGSPVPEALFDQTLKRTGERLSQEAAELEIVNVTQKSGQLQIDVSVTNNTGHKFPTGFPSRRVWIYLEVTDAREQVVFTSGQYSPEGKIIGVNSPYEPHHAVINSPEQVQIYQAIMGDLSGARTSTLLSTATYLKDNRLPPKGYMQSGKMSQYAGIHGKATTDVNFNMTDNQEGTGRDTISYITPLASAQFPVKITAQLLYQSSSPEFLDDIFQDATANTAAITAFSEMYGRADKSPVIVDSSVFVFRQ